jgi:hypothetical protein
MSADRRAGAGGVLALALLVGAGIAFDGRGGEPPRLALQPAGAFVAAAAPAAACPTWRIAAGQGQVDRASAALFTDGVLLLTACAGAAAEVALRGTVAAGRGAWTVVEDGSGVAFAGHVAAEGATVRVVGPARVSFSNDLAVAGEDRNLRASVR